MFINDGGARAFHGDGSAIGDCTEPPHRASSDCAQLLGPKTYPRINHYFDFRRRQRCNCCEVIIVNLHLKVCNAKELCSAKCRRYQTANPSLNTSMNSNYLLA